MIKFWDWTVSFLFVLIIGSLNGQTTLKGTILTLDNEEIENVDVSLFENDTLIAFTKSHTNGSYELNFDSQSKKLLLKLAYQNINIHQELVDFNKSNIINKDINVGLDINLLIDPITISSAVDSSMSHDFHAIRIDQNAATLAATFDDPTRALFKYPGIANTNDQANGIVYRGLPSEFLKWSIFGAEILNPNHLSNAGRRNDAPSSNAGGVLAIPYNAINTLVFNAMPNQGGQWGAISGVLDLDLDGDAKKYFRIGLLGSEIAWSDPKNKFQAIGRYSTVGLLGDLGVDFDGEQINYQDLFLKYKINKNLKWFAVMGTSNNNKSQIDPAITLEDLQEKTYASQFLSTGFNWNYKKLQTSLAFSYRTDNKTTNQDDFDWEPRYFIVDNMKVEERKVSLRSDYQIFINRSFGSLNTGLLFNWFENKTQFNLLEIDRSLGYIQASPFVAYQYSKNLSNNSFLTGHASANFHYDTYADIVRTEPSLGLEWWFKKISVFLDFSHRSQIKDQLAIQLNFDNDGPYRTRATVASFGIKYDNHKNQTFILRAYRYWISDVSQQDLSMDLVLEFFDDIPLEDTQWDGIECSYSNKFKNGFFFNINGSLSYDHLNRSELLINSSVAKLFEFKKGKSLSVMMSVNRRDYDNTQSRGLSYFRLDNRLLYKFKSANTLILDIQNLTNAQNIAYRYFDPVSNSLQEEILLGTIPILTYQRDF